MIEKSYITQNDSSIDVSIIISCKNEVDTLKSTIDSIMKSNNSLSFEIIVVNDGSKDESVEFLKSDCSENTYKDIVLIETKGVGCAEARNAGAKAARGKYLFFCDAHIKVPQGWLDDLVNTLKNYNAHLVAPCIVNMQHPSAAGYGMTWNNQLNIIWQCNKPNGITETPIVCGCTFGIKKEVFEKIYGFDKLFIGYGVEDQEICLKAWLYGYKIIVNPEVKVKHLFRSIHPYTIIHTHGVYNLLCLAYYHFKLERLEKLIKLLSIYDIYSDAIANIKSNSDSIINQRNKYFNERVYSDDFFFKKFNIDF